MSMNPPSAAIMTPSQRSVQAELVERRWFPTAGEDDSRAEREVNHSAPVTTYDSTHGVCNELARIAMNRSAVMQAYDSMFPRAGMAGATARRAPRQGQPRPGWVQRMLDILGGRTAR
jgi:hypothetical protein